MSKKGDIVHGCIFSFHIVYFCLCLDELGDFLLGDGSFGDVCNAILLSNKKEYVIKISSLELEANRKVADSEKECLERLKGSSPYVVELADCFDEV
jgi:hypothetical protein